MADIKIKMTKTVKADFGFLATAIKSVAEKDKIYDAVSNSYGAISVLFDTGEKLGVKPSEFEFIEAPAWVLEKHGKLAELIGKDKKLSELSK